MKKNQRDDKIKKLLDANDDLKEQNLKLNLEIIRLKKEVVKVCFIGYGLGST